MSNVESRIATGTLRKYRLNIENTAFAGGARLSSATAKKI
jgi:hypothetical protein